MSFEPPSAESWVTQSGAGYSALVPGKSEVLLPGTPNSYDLPQPVQTLAMQGCSIKDRFDRSSTLAYNFADGQSQLAFSLDAKGPTLSDPGRFEFKGVGLKFTYKLQKIPTKKERCRYASPVQGFLGSAYNEFMLRESDTVGQELKARGLDFW